MSLTPRFTQSYFYRKWVFAVCKLKKMNIFRRGRRSRHIRRFRHFCLYWRTEFARSLSRARSPLFDRRFQNVVAKGRPNASAPGSSLSQQPPSNQQQQLKGTRANSWHPLREGMARIFFLSFHLENPVKRRNRVTILAEKRLCFVGSSSSDAASLSIITVVEFYYRGVINLNFVQSLVESNNFSSPHYIKFFKSQWKCVYFFYWEFLCV